MWGCFSAPAGPPDVSTALVYHVFGDVRTSKSWSPPDRRLDIGFMELPPGAREATFRAPEDANTARPPDPEDAAIRRMTPAAAVRHMVETRIAPLVALTFRFVDDPAAADIRIRFVAGRGAWSAVGRDAEDIPADQPTMNLGYLDAATILHEMLHALGMGHEHKNPQGWPIRWDLSALYRWAWRERRWSKPTVDRQIVTAVSEEVSNGSAFDEESVMLYYYPENVTLNLRGAKQNQRLSASDVMWLHNMYPTGKTEAAVRRAWQDTVPPDPALPPAVVAAGAAVLGVATLIAAIIGVAMLRRRP